MKYRGGIMCVCFVAGRTGAIHKIEKKSSMCKYWTSQYLLNAADFLYRKFLKLYVTYQKHISFKYVLLVYMLDSFVLM